MVPALLERLRALGASRTRWPLALLLASLGVTTLAAVEAQRAVRSQRATAEHALRDYASFAAWSYQEHVRASLALAVREVIGPVNHGEGLHTSPRVPSAQELPHLLRWDERCQCHRARNGPNPTIYFGFVLGSDTLATGINSSMHPERGWLGDLPPRLPPEVQPRRYDAAERRWVHDTVTQLARAGGHREWGFAFLAAEREGQPRYLAYTLMPTSWGDTLVYGYEYDALDVARALRAILDRDEILPPSLVRGRASRDLVRLEVRRGGAARPIFTVGDSAGAPWSLDAASALPASYGGLVVRAQLRPELAGSMVIGGLPRSRLPFLLGLLALAAALSVVAVAQLRREGQLARLRETFVASVSHELRTPLAQIRLYVETLRLGRYATREQRDRALAHVDRETVRLSHLVENVLRFSGRLEAPDPGVAAPLARTDLATEVREIVDEYAPLASPRRVSIAVEHADAAPPVAVELQPGALRQILLNLLDNAVKYGPPGQHVTVAVRERGGLAALAVSDEGPGVPAAEREAIWRPFHRGAAAARSGIGGSGIGLTVVRAIVERHGGRVVMDDAPGGGARVTVELPLAPAMPHDAPAVAEALS